jgi:hypothetical protein
MGFDIAMERQSWSHIGFIFFSIVSFTFTGSYFVLHVILCEIRCYFSIFLSIYFGRFMKIFILVARYGFIEPCFRSIFAFPKVSLESFEYVC